jgi:hypothetical protein
MTKLIAVGCISVILSGCVNPSGQKIETSSKGEHEKESDPVIDAVNGSSPLGIPSATPSPVPNPSPTPSPSPSPHTNHGLRVEPGYFRKTTDEHTHQGIVNQTLPSLTFRVFGVDSNPLQGAVIYFEGQPSVPSDVNGYVVMTPKAGLVAGELSYTVTLDNSSGPTHFESYDYMISPDLPVRLELDLSDTPTATWDSRNGEIPQFVMYGFDQFGNKTYYGDIHQLLHMDFYDDAECKHENNLYSIAAVYDGSFSNSPEFDSWYHYVFMPAEPKVFYIKFSIGDSGFSMCSPKMTYL